MTSGQGATDWIHFHLHFLSATAANPPVQWLLAASRSPGDILNLHGSQPLPEPPYIHSHQLPSTINIPHPT